MRKSILMFVAAVLAVSFIGIAGCKQPAGQGEKGGAGVAAQGPDAIMGTWTMVDNPSKSVKIYKEGDQIIYEGSQGKTPATRVDDNTLTVPMMGIEVSVVLDPASGVLTVSFMGETYKYKKVG